LDRKRSAKLVVVGQKRREKMMHARCDACCHLWRVQRSQPFMLFSAHCYQFWAFSRSFDSSCTWVRLQVNFFCAQLPPFFSKFGTNCS